MMASDDDGMLDRTDAQWRLSRYDFGLAVIPAAFLLAGVVSQLVPAPIHAALAGATAVGALALLDGMFFNPPRSGSGAA